MPDSESECFSIHMYVLERERPVSLSGAEQKCGLNGEMI